MSLIDRFELSVPLIQAPMAGVATPSLAAAVSEAGALGSIGVGATDAAGARAMIEEVRSSTILGRRSNSRHARDDRFRLNRPFPVAAPNGRNVPKLAIPAPL